MRRLPPAEQGTQSRNLRSAVLVLSVLGVTPPEASCFNSAATQTNADEEIVSAVPADSMSGSSVPVRRSLRLGIRLGLGLPWLSFDEDDLAIRFDDELLVGVVPVNNTVRPSFVGGLTLIYAINSFFALEPRLFYSGQGGILKGDGVVTIRPAPEVPFRITVEETFKLAYLEIPVLARLSRERDGQCVYFGVGPVAGILLRSKHVFEAKAQLAGYYPDVYAENDEISNMTEDLAAGILAVIGFEFRGKRANGFLELAFEAGLTRIYDGLEDVHSRVFSVMLGVGY